MVIRFLCLGQPTAFTPLRVYSKDGCGGAELALHFITKEMASRGHEVEVFIPVGKDAGNYDGVDYIDQRHFDGFNKERPADILVCFRNPYFGSVNAKRLVFLSCDQYTVGDRTWRNFFREQEPTIMAISTYHADYLARRYNLDRASVKVIYLGANVDDYSELRLKRPNQIIWCSQARRGLEYLRRAWRRIHSSVHNASLVITGSQSLWGWRSNDEAYGRFISLPNVTYVGAVPRKDLAIIQSESDVMLYPSIYYENFCIAAAECMMAGCVPITTGNIGALKEVIGDAGVLLDIPIPEQHEHTLRIVADELPNINLSMLPEMFADATISLLKDRERLHTLQVKARERAMSNWTYQKCVDRFFEVLH